MLGLIKQLAKLITIAVNFPALVKLLMKMQQENQETGTLEISIDIAKVVSLPKVLEYTDKVDEAAESASDSEKAFHEVRKEQIENDEDLSDSETDSENQLHEERIQQIENNEDSSDLKKEELMLAETARHTNRLAEIQRDAALAGVYKVQRLLQEDQRHITKLAQIQIDSLSQKETIRQEVAKERAIQIDPAIRTTLAPILLMVGIPAGIIWLKNIITGLDGVSAVSAEDAEKDFEQSINETSKMGPDGKYIGTKKLGEKNKDNQRILKVYSEEPIVEFKYDSGGDLINLINYIKIKDDEVTDKPDFTVNLISSYPTDLRKYFTYRLTDINKTGATIEIRIGSTDTQPKYDGNLTFQIEGWKIDRNTGRPDGRDRAFNTFIVPVNFGKTFPTES